MDNLNLAKSIQSNDQIINENFESKTSEYKLNVVELLKNKTDQVLSYELFLNKANQHFQSSNKLQFYEDKNPEIDELENIKEEVDREFRNISNSYQNDEEFIKLLQNDNTINASYMKYVEVYANFSNKLRESIGNLISESFSPYIYQDSKILYSIIRQSNKTELIEFDIEKSQQRAVNIDINMNLTNGEVMVVQLPNNELFCTGNQNGDGYSWIIDLSSYKLKQVLPSIRYRNRAEIFYYQQNVYIFGGINARKLISPFARYPSLLKINNEEKFNLKFDLIKNKWTLISPAPRMRFSSVSAVPFKQRIIIAALEFESIYEYDINLESYTEIKFNLGTTEKLIIAGNSRVYLIESCICLWESEYDNEYAWENIGKCEEKLFTARSYRIIDKKSVYFGVYDEIYPLSSKFVYYEFNLGEKKSKTLKVLRFFWNSDIDWRNFDRLD